MIDDTLFFMLMVGLAVSGLMLLLFIWAAKSGQFDDSSKVTQGLLFDSEDDLNDAVKKENSIKEAKSQINKKGKE
ncbi:Cytochrome oxidase maturation protein cbb3-type [Aliarcobacter thereius]|uniref:Cbb3-type cytochrome oxidase assembly protein CcoS n=2 Tax=Aliarcobacter thereius TaxID=544718 RepID=A0A1C0B8Y1_9BACT|nr:cbb3-type cytochrome oxidase assembly protein CcoS [Aliarcobacter thereius]OCL88791.1 Cytochrome oxidase maturation protein cbb3-type [Aliarcobacter thereius]OCL92286.1 Cytochrome oxidase maturation protein cbb3-type [Aliarcobacter thereius]OCL94618.1 Cytochrome oxidase maturation protein cbb3-type [Aliarcobacter thereius LMG 24486]OCM00056.1 Cytochrome oxidase maturation protein cbb3-type [Aliarcobacter thereius]QBF15505.1 cytochrome oxidase maturation protein, cbb3-type [Aliarcobacter the